MERPPFPRSERRGRTYSGAMDNHAEPAPTATASTGRRSRARAAARVVVALSAAAAACVVAAAEPSGLAADLEQQVRQMALEATRSGVAGVSRVEISVGSLDPRLRLAPCQRIEPYLPASTRLWGRTRIGLRCVEGASPWNVFLPITVKVYGSALVAAAMLPGGSVLGPADLAQAEVDLADDASSAVADRALAIGRTLVHSLKPGQSLRQADLKPRQWFSAGETVKVIAVGPGFSVIGEGQAMTHGIEGQTARVRTEVGRILTGRPVAAHRLELSL